MTTANERRTRAGYELFLAADAGTPEHWFSTSPLAGLMAENIKWFDDEGERKADPIEGGIGSGGGTSKSDPTKSETASGVLKRLKKLKEEMPSCQIVSCLEVDGLVHTVDHGVRQTTDGKKHQVCASSFKFNGDGKVEEVRFCSNQEHFDLPDAPEETST